MSSFITDNTPEEYEGFIAGVSARVAAGEDDFGTQQDEANATPRTIRQPRPLSPRDEYVYFGEMEPVPLEQPTILPLPSRFSASQIEYNQLLIAAQMEYIEFVSLYATGLEDFYRKQRASHSHGLKKLELLMRIESTDFKYLPTQITPEKRSQMMSKWRRTRWLCKLQYFWYRLAPQA